MLREWRYQTVGCVASGGVSVVVLAASEDLCDRSTRNTWNGSPQRELTTNTLSGKLGADHSDTN
jgi:hypothetical protein